MKIPHLTQEEIIERGKKKNTHRTNCAASGKRKD